MDKSVMKSFSEKVFRKLDVYCQNQGEFFYTFPTAIVGHASNLLILAIVQN